MPLVTMPWALVVRCHDYSLSYHALGRCSCVAMAMPAVAMPLVTTPAVTAPLVTIPVPMVVILGTALLVRYHTFGLVLLFFK